VIIYYGTPVKSSAQVYYGAPVKSSAEIYYGTPVELNAALEEGWEFMAIGTMDAALSSASITGAPGNYNGYAEKFSLIGRTEVRLVGKDGSWNDGGGAPAWRAFLNFVTQIDSGDLGITGAAGNFNTSSEAETTWIGKSLELSVGEDGQVWWGIGDVVPGDNYGIIRFEIWAR